MDLTDHNIKLDRRVLDCIVRLDKESTKVVTGYFLYEPNVEFESVVLPPLLKTTITDAVAHFDTFRADRKKNNFDEVIAYGVGLTLIIESKNLRLQFGGKRLKFYCRMLA